MNRILNFKRARLAISGTLCKVLMQCIMVVVLVSCQKDPVAPDVPSDIVPQSPGLSVREIGGTATFEKLAIDPNYVFEVVLNLAKGTKNTEVKNKIGDILMFSLNKESDFKSVLVVDVEKDAKDKDVDVLVYAKLKDSAFKDLKTAYLNPTISVSSDFGVTEPYSSDQALEIYRSPIIFVHGLASDSTTFTPMITRIKASGLYADNLILAADYAATSMDYYNTNLNVVPGAIDDIIKKNQTTLIPMVNLVGHSMGGILGRLYLQSKDYRKDIASLITIDTPHYGSQGADLLIDLGETYNETFFAGFASAGSFVDLQVDSKATISLNTDNFNLNKVPSHCITADIDLTDVLDTTPNEESEFVPYLIATILDGLAANIYQGKNDIVVPLASQIGVADNKFTTHFDNKWHCNVHTSDAAADRVISLLSDVSNPEVFTTDGFKNETLEYNFVLPSHQIIPSGEINISKKNVTYSPTEDKTSVIFLCFNADEELRGIERDVVAPYEYKVSPLIKSGEIVVIAFAGDKTKILHTSDPVKF